MSEAEFEMQREEFVKQLKDYPQVGRRPFGYPKQAWWTSGAMALLGALLQLPLLLSREVERQPVVSALFGVLLLACAFAMRMTAFTSAAHGAMDRWLYEQIEAAEKQRRDDVAR
jgi:hypothetical protein